jgi:DNA-binding beta-propeller fold protein YncE
MLKQPVILQDEISKTDEASTDLGKSVNLSRLKLNMDEDVQSPTCVPRAMGSSSWRIEMDLKRKTNLWSRIRFKFRFINFFIARKQTMDNNHRIYQMQKDRFIQDSKRQRPKFANDGNFKRSQSSRSQLNEKRRIKSESEKYATDSVETSFGSDDYGVNSYLEIYSSPHLNCPQSLKVCENDPDMLLMLNSDNETVDVFNCTDKVLTTFIDLTVLRQSVHTCVTPVDIAQSKSNSHFFISDWLNDEIVICKGDFNHATSLANSKDTSRKYFSSPFGLAIDHINDYLYVCNTGMDSVDVFDSNLEHFCTIGDSMARSNATKPKGSTCFSSPKWITGANWGFAISDWDSNQVKLIDRNTHKIVRTLNDCMNPESLTILDSTGTELLVLSSSTKNFLKMYDILSGRLIKAYDYFGEEQDLCSIYGLRGLCVSNQKIYFTDCIENRIFICNL